MTTGAVGKRSDNEDTIAIADAGRIHIVHKGENNEGRTHQGLLDNEGGKVTELWPKQAAATNSSRTDETPIEEEKCGKNDRNKRNGDCDAMILNSNSAMPPEDLQGKAPAYTFE